MAGFKKQNCKNCGKYGDTIENLCIDCWTKSTIAYYDKHIAKQEIQDSVAGIYDPDKARISLGCGNYRTKIRRNGN